MNCRAGSIAVSAVVFEKHGDRDVLNTLILGLNSPNCCAGIKASGGRKSCHTAWRPEVDCDLPTTILTTNSLDMITKLLAGGQFEGVADQIVEMVAARHNFHIEESNFA